MFIPIKTRWMQLDGPQVTGLSNGVFEYMKGSFDDLLDYFNGLSIQTANDEHLSLFGLISGLVRPLISQIAQDNHFYFTEELDHPVGHGFNKGTFAKLKKDSKQNVSLPEVYYRTLLEAWANSEGDLGSLVLLDDLCYSLMQLDGSQVPYSFNILQGNIPEGRAQGDIYIDLGLQSQWSNPLYVYSVLRSVANNVYAPVPQVYISLGTADSVGSPIASPSPHEYTGQSTISLTATPAEATIYYTTNGEEPTTSSTKYTGPIAVPTTPGTWVLKSIGVLDGYGTSLTSSYTYNI